MKLDKFFLAKQVIAVVCNQWGDTGKGKLIDIFAAWADIIVRGTGGANAGHTIVVEDQKLIQHLLPSGVLYDRLGKINVIGRGVVIDPKILLDEIYALEDLGMPLANLKISHEAKLVLPYHIFFDRYSAHSKGIGTTGRGIGPTYADYTARQGFFVNDLLNPDRFREKLYKYLESKKALLDSIDREKAKEVLTQDYFADQDWFHEDYIINPELVISIYADSYREQLKKYVADVYKLVQQAHRKGKNILLEGAQGALLSLEYGTTTYQTSSDSTIEGLCHGCYLKETQVDFVLGIAKGPIMTRVGAGPFPTEIGGKHSEDYCAEGHTAKEEADLYPEITKEELNSDDAFEQGLALRRVAGEYGATTGRTRRVGWLDLIALKYSMQVNGRNIALTKADVVSGVEKIKLCISYTYTGEDVEFAGKTIHKGEILNEFPRFSEILEHCVPNFMELPGWDEDITKCDKHYQLPKQLQVLVNFIEVFTHGKIHFISVGPDREQIVLKE